MPTDAPLHGSYDPEDVTFLLTPMTMATIDIASKERLIQSGARHYSEMLSPEAAPSDAYLRLYHAALAANGLKLASHINTLATALEARATGPIALVSLVRAGTPIAALLARVLRRRGVSVSHHAISIIRGRGIDHAALTHILSTHAPASLVFIDGWTGKGAIAAELRGSNGAALCGIQPYLAVVADPAGCADLAATSEDYVIPSGLLGGIVSGLVSRSVLNAAIAPGMFHGCVMLDHLAPHDLSRAHLDAIDALTLTVPPQTENLWDPADRPRLAAQCRTMLQRIAHDHGVDDLNRIKPGIAESTRAVLRRAPYRLLVSDEADPNLRHLMLLASENGVAVGRLQSAGVDHAGAYRAVAIIAGIGGE